MPTRSASLTAAGEIRSHLARQRLTQTNLADGTGITIHALRRRLSGEVPFTLDELSAIAAFLSVDAGSLLVGAVAS